MASSPEGRVVALLEQYQSSSPTDLEVETEVADLNLLSSLIASKGVANIVQVLGGSNSLTGLVSALFHRRFAWSEHAFVADQRAAATLEDTFGDGEQAMRDLASEELRLVCDAIDGVFDAFSREEISLEVIDALEHCVVDSHSPVVRGQAYKHFFEWLHPVNGSGSVEEQAAAVTTSASEPVFVRAKSLIVRGITDMWSAIRRRCAAQLSRTVSYWSLGQLEIVWLELLEIASGEKKDMPWQAQEGAALVMTALMRKFSWVSQPGADPAAPRKLQFQGRLIGDVLPHFVRHGLKPVLFKLLAHAQLSVRETVSRAFSAFLSRSPFEQTLQCFDEVVWLLTRGPGAEELDPYKCEGLLKFSVVLVKLIPVPYLLKRWETWFGVFDKLLSHPASTVRQACSSVFKHIVARDTSNARLFILLLQSLAENWAGSEEKSWEWKEGRLLAYELILGLLVANHHHYVFPGQRDPRSTDSHSISAASALLGGAMPEVSPMAPKLGLRGQASVGNLLHSHSSSKDHGAEQRAERGGRPSFAGTSADFNATLPELPATLAATTAAATVSGIITAKDRSKGSTPSPSRGSKGGRTLSRSKSERDVKVKPTTTAAVVAATTTTTTTTATTTATTTTTTTATTATATTTATTTTANTTAAISVPARSSVNVVLPPDYSITPPDSSPLRDFRRGTMCTVEETAGVPSNQSPISHADRRGTIAGTSPTVAGVIRRRLGLPSGIPRRNSIVALSLVDQLKSLSRSTPPPSPLAHPPQPAMPPSAVSTDEIASPVGSERRVPSPLIMPDTASSDSVTPITSGTPVTPDRAAMAARSVRFPLPAIPETPEAVTPAAGRSVATLASPITPSFAVAHADVDLSPPWTESWWDGMALRSSSDLLRDVLLQVSSCLLPGTRWELRRMVDQVMPLLIDTALLVNPDVLRGVWSIRDPLTTGNMVIVIPFSLKFALRRYARLRRQLHRAAAVSGWSDDAIVRALEVIALVESGCTVALPALVAIARGCSDDCGAGDDAALIHVTDRVRVTAAEVIVRMCVLLPVVSTEAAEEDEIDLHGTVQAVAHALCPNMAPDWAEGPMANDLPQIRSFRHANAAEKLFVPSLAPLLPIYLQYCSPRDVAAFAPYVACWGRVFAEDAGTQLHLVESLRLVVVCAAHLVVEGGGELEEEEFGGDAHVTAEEEGMAALNQAVDTLEALILDKRVEPSVLSLVFRIWVEVCHASEEFLVNALKALVRRLVLENVDSVMQSGEAFLVEHAGSLHFDDSRASLNALEVDEDDILVEDDEKDERMSEPAPEKPDDDSVDDDDWDDWDEDDDTVEALAGEFGQFLRLLERELDGSVSMLVGSGGSGLLDKHEMRILKWLWSHDLEESSVV